MKEEPVRGERRSVMLHTVRGSVEGEICLSPNARTLDGLNMLHHSFVTVENPVVTSDDWSIDKGTLVLNTDGILFVVERSNWVSGRGDRAEGARFSRSAVRLHVGLFEIEGFLHIPGSGRPLARLKQEKHPFLAVTSASIHGPDALLASRFVAVNRAHIMVAQELRPDTEVDEPLVGELLERQW